MYYEEGHRVTGLELVYSDDKGPYDPLSGIKTMGYFVTSKIMVVFISLTYNVIGTCQTLSGR